MTGEVTDNRGEKPNEGRVVRCQVALAGAEKGQKTKERPGQGSGSDGWGNEAKVTRGGG